MKVTDSRLDVQSANPELRPLASSALTIALLVAAVVFAASLFGILTRPLGFLAAFWPANALLLGLFVRAPYLASPWGWLGAVVGYVTADLLTGGHLSLTLWLTAANLAGVLVGYLLFLRLDAEDRLLLRPQSVLYLFGICICVGMGSALVGAGIAPTAFEQSLMKGVEFWFTTELVNNLIVLPVMLTAPVLTSGYIQSLRSIGWSQVDIWRLAPFVALLLSLAVAVLVRGPGAITFPIPALLWCALTYSLFGTVLLTLFVSVGILIAVSLGVLHGHVPATAAYIDESVSMRLGVIFLALGPLTVASINAARNELLRTLDYAANHDALTGTLMRRAFASSSEACIAQQRSARASVAVLMLDIDHFKQINDRYGHAAGDSALKGFVAAISPALRAEDLLGRLGGEEFAVLMPDISHDDALQVAERLREQVQLNKVVVDSGESLSFTVSIGLSWEPEAAADLGQMLRLADEALYQAKAAGRNQTVSL